MSDQQLALSKETQALYELNNYLFEEKRTFCVPLLYCSQEISSTVNLVNENNIEDDDVFHGNSSLYGEDKLRMFRSDILNVLLPIQKIDKAKKCSDDWGVSEQRVFEILHETSNVAEVLKVNDLCQKLTDYFETEMVPYAKKCLKNNKLKT